MSQRTLTTRLVALVCTDVVGSVELKARLGTPTYLRLAERHDELFRRALDSCGQNPSVPKDTGDGYLAALPTITAAVNCALAFQHYIGSEPWSPAPVAVRVGVHFGQVIEVRDDDDPDAAKLTGIAVDLVSRVMSLAVGGQILMTQLASNEARQFVDRHPCDPSLPLEWVSHGLYRAKGLHDPVEICEVGASGAAPLSAPPGSEKMEALPQLPQEPITGWRPGVALEIPGRPGWLLEKKIGEGGFGEVWLGRHQKLHEASVFKFCFDAERLRSFQREMTLFRLLRDVLGDRPDIVRLREIKLDAPPYFLESEYTDCGNLADWAESKGGVDRIPLSTRIDLVCRIADAVAAAHSVGVLHKDIKPSNILIHIDHQTGEPRPRLSDFGIGVLTDPALLYPLDITDPGVSTLTENDSSRTGTRLYAPPEMQSGSTFTVQGDIFAVGVLLYQMVIGDLAVPLSTGWDRDVHDPLLREDIADCVDGDPARRPAGAAEVSKRLRALDLRRADHRRRSAALAAVHRRKRLAALVAVLAVVSASSTLVAVHALRLKTAAETAESKAWVALSEARRQQAAAENQTAVAQAVVRFQTAMVSAADPFKMGDPVTVRQAIEAAVELLDGGEYKKQPLVEASVREVIGQTLESLGLYDEAAVQAQKSWDLRSAMLPASDLAVASSMNELGKDLAGTDTAASCLKAEQLFRASLNIRRSKLPPDSPLIAAVENNLGTLLAELQRPGDFDEGRRLFADAVAVAKKAAPQGDQDVVDYLNNFGYLYWKHNQRDEAEALFSESLNVGRKNFKPDHGGLVSPMENLGTALFFRGDLAGAERLFTEALAIRTKVVPNGNLGLALAKSNLAQVLQKQERFFQAGQLFQEALDIVRRCVGPRDPVLATALNNMGNLLVLRGYPEPAEKLLREALDIALNPSGPEDATLVPKIAASLVSLLEGEGRRGDADEIRRKAGGAVGPVPPVAAG